MRLLPVMFLGACAVDAPTSQISSDLSSQFKVVKPAVVDPAHWSDALCNDGTPFGFYVRPNPSSHVWVIYFEGGGFCDDYAHLCSDRVVQRPDMITTIPAPNGSFTTAAPAGGLVNTNPGLNDFADANIVYAHYCSSDFWAGDAALEVPTTADAWWFKGHRNVDSMIAILKGSYGLDDSLGDLRVLLAGGSSGGFAVHLNSARVENALPNAAGAQRIKLAVEAGWWIEWDWDQTALANGFPLTPSHYFKLATGPDRSVSVHSRQLWHASYDPDCEASAPTPADCLFGPYWYRPVRDRLPVLVMASTEDRAFALDEHGLQHGTPEIGAWEQQMRDSLLITDGVFAGGDPYHTFTSSDVGLAIGTSTMRLREMILAFWNGTEQRLVFDPVRPAVTINQATSQLDPTTATTAHFTVQFSEDLNLAANPSALSFAGSTATGVHVVNISPTTSSSLFDVTIGTSSPGDVRATVLPNQFTGAYGRPNLPSVSYDNVVTFQ